MAFHVEMPTPRIFSSYTPLVWEWAGLEPRRSMSEFEGRTIDETEGNILGRQTPNAPGGTFQWFWGGDMVASGSHVPGFPVPAIAPKFARLSSVSGRAGTFIEELG